MEMQWQLGSKISSHKVLSLNRVLIRLGVESYAVFSRSILREIFRQEGIVMFGRQWFFQLLRYWRWQLSEPALELIDRLDFFLEYDSWAGWHAIVQAMLILKEHTKVDRSDHLEDDFWFTLPRIRSVNLRRASGWKCWFAPSCLWMW